MPPSSATDPTEHAQSSPRPDEDTPSEARDRDTAATTAPTRDDDEADDLTRQQSAEQAAGVEGGENPPLPSEDPPLPVEDPPLPSEAPPLPTEDPPLPAENPPLPTEDPPLPAEPVPQSSNAEDDGWTPVWDAAFGAYYFYNSVTGETTWTNPRVPDAVPVAVAPVALAPGVEAVPLAAADIPVSLEHDPYQYNPAIHGDYDPTALYAQPRPDPAVVDEGEQYAATAAFNRFTGKFQSSKSVKVPENYNDENKSKRQMEFYFDVDAAANSHDGKSLKAERQTKKLTKKELKEFKEKRRVRKEEKRRAWLKD